MTEMLNSGLELMWVGMGIVFLFLVMLIVAVNVMSYLVQRYLHTEPAVTQAASGVTVNGADASRTAAITAAVHQHRNRHKA